MRSPVPNTFARAAGVHLPEGGARGSKVPKWSSLQQDAPGAQFRNHPRRARSAPRGGFRPDISPDFHLSQKGGSSPQQDTPGVQFRNHPRRARSAPRGGFRPTAANEPRLTGSPCSQAVVRPSPIANAPCAWWLPREPSPLSQTANTRLCPYSGPKSPVAVCEHPVVSV